MDSPGSAQYHTSVQLLDSQQNSNHSAYSERTRRYDWLHAFSRSNSLPCDSVLHFMRGVMDECTHLGNFSCPVDTSLVIVVAAKSDAYIPRDHVLSIEDLWPGAEVRFIETGHIAAYLFKQSVFRCVFWWFMINGVLWSWVLWSVIAVYVNKFVHKSISKYQYYYVKQCRTLEIQCHSVFLAF